jgi:hypothetical protein
MVVYMRLLAMLLRFVVGAVVVAVRQRGMVMGVGMPGGAMVPLAQHASFVMVGDVVVIVAVLHGGVDMLRLVAVTFGPLQSHGALPCVRAYRQHCSLRRTSSPLRCHPADEVARGKRRPQLSTRSASTTCLQQGTRCSTNEPAHERRATMSSREPTARSGQDAGPGVVAAMARAVALLTQLGSAHATATLDDEAVGDPAGASITLLPASAAAAFA